MRHSFLDKYSDRDSLIHRLDPRTKLVATLAFIAVVVLTPSAGWAAYALYFGIVAALILFPGCPKIHTGRSLEIVPFVLLCRLPPFSCRGNSPALQHRLMALSFTRGVQVFWNVLAKSWLLFSASSSVLHHTFPPSKAWSTAYAPRDGLDASFMSATSSSDRRVMRMKQARDSRNFGGRRLWQIRPSAMIGIFSSAATSARAVYAAMVSADSSGTPHVASLRFSPWTPFSPAASP
jgi:cobalt/nickel transport system permease protein